MPMMDDLVTELTWTLTAQDNHHGDVSPSDLEGRRETQPSPPGASLGASPAPLPADG